MSKKRSPRRCHRRRASERDHRLCDWVCRRARFPRSLDLRSSPAAGLAALVTTRGSMKPQDDRALGGAVRLLHGRFEAQFDDAHAARAAARDAHAVGFVVDVRQETTGWLAVGRRQLPYPGDERDRYASRFHAIATQHGGVLSQFVEEPPEILATHVAETSARGHG